MAENTLRIFILFEEIIPIAECYMIKAETDERLEPHKLVVRPFVEIYIHSKNNGCIYSIFKFKRVVFFSGIVEFVIGAWADTSCIGRKNMGIRMLNSDTDKVCFRIITLPTTADIYMGRRIITKIRPFMTILRKAQPEKKKKQEKECQLHLPGSAFFFPHLRQVHNGLHCFLHVLHAHPLLFAVKRMLTRKNVGARQTHKGQA